MSNAAAKVQSHDEQIQNERLAGAIDRYYKFANQPDLEYVPVNLALIILHKLPDIALFLEGGPSMYKVFRRRGAYVSQKELDTLAESNIAEVFLQREDLPAFSQYVESIIRDVAMNSPMADEQKVTLLRTSAIQVMSDIFAAPTPANIERGVKAVSGFVYVLMRDPKAYQMLLKLSSHDHYTLQHSVGVATNAIILAKKSGIDDEASLIEAGVGGLLHDVGKTKVPKELINKKGPLDAAEWVEMKKHAMYGYEIVKDNPNVGTRAKLAVLQHHEDAHGSGYPLGIKLDQVSIFAKVVSIADIYNAITTDRSYSSAKPPFEAFKLIKEKLSHKVDLRLLEQMIMIYGGKVT